MRIGDAIAIVASALVAGFLLVAIGWLVVTMYRTRPLHRFTIRDRVWAWAWRIVGGYRDGGRLQSEAAGRPTDVGWALDDTAQETNAPTSEPFERSPSIGRVHVGAATLTNSSDVARGCAELPHNAETTESSGECVSEKDAED